MLSTNVTIEISAKFKNLADDRQISEYFCGSSRQQFVRKNLVRVNNSYGELIVSEVLWIESSLCYVIMAWARATEIGKILIARVDFDVVRSLLIIIALNSLFTSISNIFCHSNSYQFYYLMFFVVLTTNFFLSKCSYLPMLLVVRHPKIDDKCRNRTIKNLSFLQQCWNEN